MKIKKKALLYDISNLAYMIADSAETDRHSLHQLMDICQDGNVDRVARVLGHAYSHVIDILSPVIKKPQINPSFDWSAKVCDYEIRFLDEARLTPQRKIRIKECVKEYMVCMVICDLLSITLPSAASLWKEKSEQALSSIAATALTVSNLTRRVSPL